MRRLVLALVATLALAACGSDGGASPPPTTLPDINADLTCPPPAQFAGPESFTTALAHGPLRAGQPTTWTITVTNVSTEDLVLAYAAGQKADVTLSSGGQVAYRWSDGKSFSQVFLCDTVPAGGSLDVPLTDNNPLPPAGEYELTASLQSAPLPPDEHDTVTVMP
jgi:hypothetical protein